MRKAQGMSLRVVIIAALVLIILVVLILIFSGKLKIFGAQTSETTSQFSGNKCQVPGTSNECSSDPIGCKNKGGAYMEVMGGYDDCNAQFGSGSQCCFM